MTKYLDKKEQVYDLQLTSYGHYLLSIGSFKPTFYAFYDDNIIYDGRYARKNNETQNDPVHRIQNETHFHGSLVLFEDVDAIPTNNKGSGINYFDLDVTPIKEVPRKDTFKYDAALGDAHYDGRSPNYAPAWKIVAMNGKITNAGEKDYYNNLNIPQINIELNYQKSTMQKFALPAPPPGSDLDTDDFLTETEPFLDNRAINFISDDAAIYVEELNTSMLVHNFDIEVFEMQVDPGVNSTGSVKILNNPIANQLITIDNGREVFTYTFTTNPSAWSTDCSPRCADDPVTRIHTGTRTKRNVFIAPSVVTTPAAAKNKTLLNLMAAINDTTDSGLEAATAAAAYQIEITNNNGGSYGLYGALESLNRPITTSDTGGSYFTILGFAGGTARKEVLRRKFFETEMPQIVDGMMVSETPTLKFHDVLPSSSVEYYFDIYADYDADAAEVCKYSQTLNKESYFIDLDFDCEQEYGENTYYDIYGSEVEPEICLD